MRGISGAILLCGMVVFSSFVWAQDPLGHDEAAEAPLTQDRQPEAPAIDYNQFVESGAKAARDQEAREEFEKTLQSLLKSPLQFEQLPLSELVDQISGEYELSIMFDTAALDALAISPETEITIDLRNVSLRQALNLILRQPGLENLTYIFDDGVLLITTEEKANETMSVCVYRVDDLVSKYDLAASHKPYSTLVDIITTNVQFDSWRMHDSGEGQILLMRPGLLIVSQTQRIHEQIQELLGLIRLTAAEIEESHGSTEATGTARRHFGF